MSQVGQIISINSITGKDWVVQYQYQLDAGGTQQAQINIGDPTVTVPPYPQTVPLWASPNSTITVVPNPPGTTNPVVLPCPDLVKFAAFGVAVKGLPTS
jgi:hypothetical protein